MRSKEAIEPGTLYVCPTPIGNLEDITLRVLRVLKEVDLVAAEDTRHSGLLLAHFGISKPFLGYREHDEKRRVESILSKLESGLSVALVSDAGTPGLSDPGHKLIRAAIQKGFRVEVLPGPSAAVTALVASGLPTDSFVYQGFLPKKAGERRKLVEELLGSGRTVVIYESPKRTAALLRDIAEVDSERFVAIARELTKKFEEVLRGSAKELLERLSEESVRGEIVVVVDKGEERKKILTAEELAVEVQRLMSSGNSKKSAIEEVTRKTGVAKREVFEAVKHVRANP